MPSSDTRFKPGCKGGPGRPPGKRLIKHIPEALKRVEKAIEGGKTPLEYALEVMRDQGRSGEDRLEAARIAAPFIHRKQPQAVEVDQQGTISVRIETPFAAMVGLNRRIADAATVRALIGN